MPTGSSSISFVPSRKKATIINLIRDYASMTILVIQGIVLVPLYLHYIDARLYGAWLATGSIVAYMGLLDLGFSSVIVQKISVVAGQRDYKRLGEMIGTSLVITCIVALLPILLAILLFTKVPAWVNMGGVEAHQIAKAFLVAAVSTSLMLIAYGVGGTFLGLQRVGVVSIQFVISSLIGIMATLLFLHIGWGIVSIPSGLLTQAALLAASHCIYLWWWLRNNLPLKSLCFKQSLFRDLFRPSSWVFMSRLSNVAATQSDSLIVATMIDPRLTTTLVLTKKSSDIITIIASRISSAFMPSLAHLSGEKDLGMVKLKQFMLGMMKISLIIGIFGVGGVFLLNKEFVRLWVGQDYYGGALLTGLICVSGFIIICNTIVSNSIFAKGKIRTTAKASMLEAIVRVPLSIALCYYFGIKGVVLAGIIAVLPTSLLMQTRCLFRILNLSWHQVIRSLSVLFIKASVPLGLGLLVRLLWSPTGLVGFIVFSTVYSVITFIFYYSVDSSLREFSIRVFNRYVVRA